MRESSGRCPVTFLRENNGHFWGTACFSGGLGGPHRGLGVVNCNQAKMPEGKSSRLGGDPEILIELSGFAERSKFPVSTLSHYSGALNAERNGSCWLE